MRRALISVAPAVLLAWSTLSIVAPASSCHAVEACTGITLVPIWPTLNLAGPESPKLEESTTGKGSESTQGSQVETGTDPSKLLLRFEISPQFVSLPGEGCLVATNLKLDIPLSKSFGVALELPVVHAGGFSAPIEDQSGLGDVFVRARNVWSFERSSIIAGAEIGLKTADDELLGSGKWQANPSLAYVHYLSNEYLLALAGKQRLSIEGDADRDDINQSELRVIGIYINPDGWWLQADYQPKIDWKKGERVSHLLELEAGTMLTRGVGVSVRPGVGIGSNRDRDWSIGFGLRFFF